MSKFLIVGSAPGIEEWWEAHSGDLGEFHACPINNAWKVVGAARLRIWFRSTDFRVLGRVQPSPAEELAMAGATVQDWEMRPRWYDVSHPGAEPGGTMLLSCIYHLLNTRPDMTTLRVVGSDFQYSGGRTHFYGAGTPDPLRYGTEWLDKVLLGARLDCLRAGVDLGRYELGGPSRLPFKVFPPGE